MESTLSAEQTELIERIATDRRFVEFSLEVKPGAGGSFGSILSVRIKDKYGLHNQDLIVKVASKNEKVREVNPVRKAYLREIYMYETVFPAFVKLERANKIKLMDCFSSHPKMYGSIQTEGAECLVMEDLIASGYKMYDRRTPMNAEHVITVCREYARLHSISFKMREQDLAQFQELTKPLTNIFEKHSLDMAKKAIELGKKCCEGNEVATAALERVSDGIETFITEDLMKSEDKLVVIHQDGWINNLFFKYGDKDDPQAPTKASIIDWQFAEIGSPAMDLTYFIFTNGSLEVIKHYEKFLQMYMVNLGHYLDNMGSQVEILFPEEELREHWKKYCKFGLLMAIVMLKFMISDEEEIPHISLMARSGMTFMDRIDFESTHEEEYKKRVSDLITAIAERKLI